MIEPVTFMGLIVLTQLFVWGDDFVGKQIWLLWVLTTDKIIPYLVFPVSMKRGNNTKGFVAGSLQLVLLSFVLIN